MTHSSFSNITKDIWENLLDEIHNTIELYKQTLKVWNKETFGNIIHRKRFILARLMGIQKTLCRRQDSQPKS